ncbi:MULTISPECIES: hypothetical protein [Paenibacillus]|nr:hypothetical protein [Paenibacillus anaericanus]
MSRLYRRMQSRKHQHLRLQQLPVQGRSNSTGDIPSIRFDLTIINSIYIN